QAVGIVAKRIRQHFDCDIAIQACVAGTPDFTHAASTEPREDFVWAELCARGNRHSLPPPFASRQPLPIRITAYKARRPRFHFPELLDDAARGEHLERIRKSQR